ncbi:efflux RND transporter periplasmic adaptor subunit [Comamonas testosteroni]|uniref:efflux RND transporter periplasmic adaptor subunit n=1 Tax=Comamonas testosteroni TaxID=285 RepID=UPI0005B4780E|nr:efflux RND transporter periplasmic adaptor subunit [Comamonas testosteroni]
MQTKSNRSLGVVLSVLAFSILAGCGGEPDTETTTVSTPRALSVAKVESRSMVRTQLASGLLVSREEVTVSSELSGYRIARLAVEEGDFVRAGEPLAYLDSGLLQSKVRQAEASLAQAKALSRQAAIEADRVKGLDGQGVLSDEQILQRRAQAETQKAAAAVADAALAGLRTESARMILRAPVDGLVIERTARLGDVSSAGASLFRIARNGVVELAAEVPEDQLAYLQKNVSVKVTLPSYEEVLGTVRTLSPRVDSKTKLGLVRVLLPKSPNLRPGGFAQAEFVRTQDNVSAVPEKAIHFEAGGPQLVVIGTDARVKRLSVVTGIRSEGWVELLKGPPAGTKVALGGGAFVVDGDVVKETQQAVVHDGGSL